MGQGDAGPGLGKGHAMSAASGLANFSREGNKLTVRGTLGINENDAFYPELMALLKAGHSEVFLDITAVHSMRSISVGSIAVFLTDAKESNLAATVIAHGAIAQLLKSSGLSSLGEIRAPEA